ncbi:hypothetical protein [Bradyrhizobium retamae]|uniref:Uncharacterized protein n=1 Tax=Bradyrhizobium retamae TaxID=1300035 RepID=A0A0R3MQ05_9BRAD|nr:hypothetical protein [Bradyrhizobium retamae]KRR22167.1 hypothetical protein CQ13_30010 [Bradyrhizobium retamae]
MAAYISAVSVPPVSQEFIKALCNAFRPFEVKPGFDRDELMQAAGEQKVIEWIKHHAAQGRTVTGEPSALRDTQTNTGAIVKLGE